MVIMNGAPRTPKRILIIAYFVILHVVAAYFIVDAVLKRRVDGPRPETGVALTPEGVDSGAVPVPSISNNANAVGANTVRTENTPAANPGGLIIPVAGVKVEQLIDSFSDARSEGRVHDAIDIVAPAGTAVLAAADGEILKFHESVPGGITIYQLSEDRRFVYYYAHLQRRADDIKVGDIVRQGKTIAFVGDTGNAGAGNYHLHFSIAAVTDPKRYWEGVYIDPYPLLRGQEKLPN